MKWNKIKITKFYTNSATYTLCCNILLKAIFFYFAKLNAKGFIRWGCLGERKRGNKQKLSVTMK